MNSNGVIVRIWLELERLDVLENCRIGKSTSILESMENLEGACARGNSENRLLGTSENFSDFLKSRL